MTSPTKQAYKRRSSNVKRTIIRDSSDQNMSKPSVDIAAALNETSFSKDQL